jgi:Zn-finger nucleic acid-binding protein
MKCPRCPSQTKVIENQNVKIDICYDGCGGIWFDWMELKKMDEGHEISEEFLKTLSLSAKKTIPVSDKLRCPTCPSQPMVRRFNSVKRQVEVDECPKCGGFWLDAGELTHIHSEFKTDNDRQHAAEKFISDTFGAQIATARAESQQKLESAQKFAKALRFICPSYYIPGKQSGGAF